MNSTHSLSPGRAVSARLRIALLLLATSVLSGCNYIIMAGYLIGGPPSIEPDFDAMTKKSMTDKDTTAVVVCYAPPEIRNNFSRVDKELEKYVSYRLAQHHVQVAPPDLVRAWLDENPDWDKAEEIGKAFNSTYVIYIDLNDYTLYEENSATLYRGRANAVVSVFEMDEDGYGEKIYSKELDSEYPILEARDTSEVTYSTFKQQYLARLSEEVGRLFYEYYNGDDIPDAT